MHNNCNNYAKKVSRWMLYCFVLFFLSSCNYQYQPRTGELIDIEIALQSVKADEFNQQILDSLEFKKYKNGSKIGFDNTSDSYVFKIQHKSFDSNGSLLIMPHSLANVSYFDEGLNLVDNFVRNGYSPEREYSSNVIAFVNQSKMSYVLINNTLSKPVNFSIENSRKLKAHDQKLLMTFTVLDSIIITLVFVNLIFYFFIRRIGYLFYSFYILCSLVSIFYQEGMVSYIPWLSGLPLGIYTHLIWLKLASIFYWLFAIVFLDLKKKSEFDYNLLKTMFLVDSSLLLFISILTFFGIDSFYSYIAISLNLFLMFSIVIAVYVPIKYAFLKQRQAIYLAIGIVVHMIAVLMRINYTFTSDPLAFWMPRMFEFGLLFEAFVLSMGLADRTMRVMEQRDDAQLKFYRADRELFCKELENSFQQRSNNTIEKYLGTQKQLDSIINSYFIASLHQLVEVKEVFYVSENGTKLDTSLVSEFDVEFDTEGYIKDNSTLMNLICDTNIPLFQKNKLKKYSQLPFAIVPIKEKEFDNLCLFLSFPSYVEVSENLIKDLYIFANTMTLSLATVRKYQKTVEASRFDNLTKIFNRETIKSKLDILCSMIPNHNNSIAVAFIDLDDFKNINDKFGHDSGDKCLVFLCNKLKEEFNQNSYVGRYGGDEFIVVFNQYTKQDIENKFNELYDYFSNNLINGIEIKLSIGVSFAKINDLEVDSVKLLKAADTALYQAKKKGKNQLFFDV